MALPPIPVARHLTRLLPTDCSDRYASGWAVADRLISEGEGLLATAPGDWDEEKISGFEDRILLEHESLVMDQVAGVEPGCSSGGFVQAVAD